MNHWDTSLRNCFAAHSMERLHYRRRDEAWVAEALESPAVGFLPVWQSRSFLSRAEVPSAGILTSEELGRLREAARSLVLLGEEEGRAVFSVDLPASDAAIPEALARFGHFEDLRRVGGLLDPRSGALLAYARAISHWHRQSRFCGACGGPTRSEEAGHMRMCIDPSCGRQHFPRTDPAIIVLVSAGDRCVLGRQPVWPDRMYSVIAGFVEPGESLELAVAREVHEETGLRVGAVHYHSSQPWPFPCSIMMGFTALAVTENISLGDEELEDARWFSRKELKAAVEKGKIRLPTRISIAWRLIEDWYDGGGAGRLREVMGP